MDSVSRISAEQGGTVDGNHQLLDFIIPNDGSIVDLSKSYFSLKFRNNNTHTSANIANAVFNNSLNLDDKSAVQTHYTPPVGLVMHAHMSNANKGNIETLRDVNSLRLNQKLYFTDEEEQIRSQLNNVIGASANKSWGYISPMIQASNNDMTGNLNGVASRDIDAELRVPMKDIFNFCKNPAYAMSDAGDTNVHLELDFGRLSQQSAYNDADFSTGANASAFGKITDQAGAVTTVVLDKQYDENYREEIPYYIGLPVTSTAGTINGANAEQGQAGVIFKTIANITYSATTRLVTLTLDSALAGDTVGLILASVLPTTAGFTAFSPQLVLYKRGDNPEIQRPYNYTTFSSERDNLGNRLNARRQYEIESECVNVLVATKSDSSSLYSDTPLEHYRIAVNNEDITNRDVVIRSPVRHDRISRYGMNSGKQVKSLMESRLKRLAPFADLRSRRENDGEIFFIMEPMPVTDKMKLVEFELKAQSGQTVGEVQIFKELLRSY